ncbi:MAG: SoxR reducing system RseC family protein [Bacteroidaceae bacterium]|nr:SoxR reducing system RseC family protein [Bacteroidaceae bacterium]
MVETIRHQGKIEGIADGIVKVRILQSSACSGCSAAKLCQSSETKEKFVDVRVADVSSYQVGDNVVLCGSLTQGLKATWWAYALPLLLVISSVVVAFNLTQSDGIAAAVALLVLVAYYGGMYAMRSKFEKRFSFTIE